jgi:DNA-3-methyladenine glycosylase I
MPERCEWPGTLPIYVAYHDEEWGVPVRDDRELFQHLLLDGAQAGLSWLTILKRRDNYRRAFDGFDPEKMARYDGRKVEALLHDDGIIRNRLKVQAFVTNARAFLDLQEELGSFSDFLWSFVGGETIQNAWTDLAQLPAETEESRAMSRALKARGFKFVGPTICYAFMQAVGLVNDHVVSCFRYTQLRNRGNGAG